MTTYVKITASCDNQTEVRVHLSDRRQSENRTAGLRDGESQDVHVFDSRTVLVRESPSVE